MWNKLFFLLFLISYANIGCAKITIKVPKPGTLEQIAQEQRLDTCYYLVVEGKLNSSDIRVLRRLAGYAEDGESLGRLRALDLSQVKFVTDKEPFMELDVVQEKLAGVVSPDYVVSYHQSPLNTSWSKQLPGSGGVTSLSHGNYYMNVKRYKPIYYLSHTLNRSLMVRSCARSYYYQNPVSMRSESQFTTSDGLSDSLWHALCKKGLDRFSGHKIEKRADGYYLTAMSKKGQFSPVTFYKCTQLRAVALPKNIKFGPHIYDESNRILYFIGKDLFCWERDEIAEGVQEKLRQQMGQRE